MNPHPLFTTAPAPRPARPAAAGLQRLGPYRLLQRLGSDRHSQLWRVQAEAETPGLLLMPIRAETEAESALAAPGRLGRIDLPGLLRGQAVDLGLAGPAVHLPAPPGPTLAERLAPGGGPAPTLAEWVGWMVELLELLAALHEAGLRPVGLAAHTVLIEPPGRARLLGIELAREMDAQGEGRREDLRLAGLLLYRGIAGHWALDEPDLPRAAARLDREIVRLGWALPQPVPAALRAIVNRAVDHEAARRYLAARSLARALRGWLDSHRDGEPDALNLLLDRLPAAGHLPARADLPQRLAALHRLEGQRLDAWIELLFDEPALAFELLRSLGAVELAGQAQGDDITTLRRAVQLLGLSGVRQAAASLRPWPGALDAAAAVALESRLAQAARAAHLAERLCPADHDGEAAGLIALLQALGELLMAYHFPDEQRQIETLVHPPPQPPGVRPLPPELAAQAVLGSSPQALAHAVARHWGLDEGLQHALQALALDRPVRLPETRLETLRCAASAGGELAAGLPPQAVEQRYQRALGWTRGEAAQALAALGAIRPSAALPA